MNKIFKVVWSKVRNCYVVVSEVAKANGKNNVKSSTARASLAAAMAVAVMMSGTAMAANVNFEGHSYTINDADGSNTAIITTTDTENYGVWGKSGNVTLGDVTINTASGGIKLVAEEGPTKLTINADNMTINSQKWSALYTTSQNTSEANRAKPGSVLTVNVGDTLKVDSVDGYLAGTIPDRSIVVNAKTIEAESDTGNLIWGTGNVTLNAQDITLETGAQSAIGISSSTASVDINAAKTLDITGDINANQGSTISLEGQHSATIDGGVFANAPDASIEVKGRDIKVIGEDHTIPGHKAAVYNVGNVDIIGQHTTTIEGCLVSKDIDAAMDVKGKDIAVNGEAYSYSGDITLDAAHSVTITDCVTAASADATINVTGKDIHITGEDPAIEGHKAAIYSEGNVGIAGTHSVVVDGCLVTKDTGAMMDITGKDITVNGNMQSYAGIMTLASEKSATINGNVTTTSADAVIGVESRDVTVNGNVQADAGMIALVGQKSTVINGDVNVKDDAIVMLGKNAQVVTFAAPAGNDVAEGTVIINGDIEAATGELYVTLDTADSIIMGAINTAGNNNAVVSLSNGATWKVTGESSVSNLAGDQGVIAINSDLLGQADVVEIETNAGTNFTLKAGTTIDLSDGAKKALENAVITDAEKASLNQAVSINGSNVTTGFSYGVYAEKAALYGDVDLVNDKVVTTMDTDNLVVAGNVQATTFNGVNITESLDRKANIADVYEKTETYSKIEVDTAINAETTRAQDVEGQLSQAITNEVTAREANDAALKDMIDAEATRAAQAEAGLGDAINAETARAQNVEGQLSQAITDEVARANAAEVQLQANIDAEAQKRAEIDGQLGDAINAETARAQAVEGQLSQAITDLVVNTQAVEGQLSQAITNETAAREANDVALKDMIDAEATRAAQAEAGLGDAINAETARAQNVEGQLSQAITNETAAREANDVALKDMIDAEATRAAQAEAGLGDAINAETARAQNVEGQLSQAITDEVARANAAEVQLQANIDAEAQKRAEIDGQLGTAINVETTRATTAEGQLAQAIADEATVRANTDVALEHALSSEIYNRTINDAQLQQNLDVETATRIEADNMLGQRIDRTNGRLDKVGAGAAALAALHPLDYDSENKLSFAAGVGNYAGQTAAAVGAFYRPNENVMFSIGGTAGNGENMVNLGASFAIGKGASGVAKMSKSQLVQEVADLKAENKDLRHELNKLRELVMKLAEK